MNENRYLPFRSEIVDVLRHTEIEYTFRMRYRGEVRPGQFFEVSIPRYGEAPISVSGIGADTVDLTIRRVGKVTNEIFEQYKGDSLFLRGPYGNGFDMELFRGKELVIVAGGTGVSPVRGVIDYFSEHPGEAISCSLIAGFKSPADILFRDDFRRWQERMNVVLTVDQAALDSGCAEGLVTKHIPELPIADTNQVAAVVVGPPVMMKFAVAELLKRGIAEAQIWISHERKMCCGIGKCGHCKIDDTYVCLDGPVFNCVKGVRLID